MEVECVGVGFVVGSGLGEVWGRLGVVICLIEFIVLPLVRIPVDKLVAHVDFGVRAYVFHFEVLILDFLHVLLYPLLRNRPHALFLQNLKALLLAPAGQVWF